MIGAGASIPIINAINMGEGSYDAIRLASSLLAGIILALQDFFN